MTKYSLQVSSGRKEQNVIGNPIDFAELDSKTREYSCRKDLIQALINKGLLPSDKGINGSWVIHIMSGEKRKKTNHKPLYKENYVPEKDEPKFEQIMKFAKEIGKIYDCYSKKENGKYIIPEEKRKDVANAMRYMQIDGKQVRGLRNPAFYNFSKDYFIKNIYIKDTFVNGDGYEIKERKKIQFTGIDVFDSLVNTKEYAPVNEEIPENFYNDLLYGFHKIFFNETKEGFNLNYIGVRKYYSAYYREFIKELEIIQAKKPKTEETPEGAQMTLNAFSEFVSENPGVVIETGKNKKKETVKVEEPINEPEVDELSDTYNIEEDGIIRKPR